MRATHSRPVPAVEPERQVPVLETRVMTHIAWMFIDDEIHTELHKRLRAGAAKYGTAWNEVNLTLDLEEEVLDAMNYVAMASVRLFEVYDSPLPQDMNQALKRLDGIAAKLEEVYQEIKELPQMEGPSSKDWLPQHGIDSAQAQKRFQEVVNG